MHTMHGTVANTTRSPPRLRLSCDIRFQPAADAVDPRHTIDGGPWDREAFAARGAAHAAAAPEGPRKPLAEAKVEWGIAKEPLELKRAPARPWPPQPYTAAAAAL